MRDQINETIGKMFTKESFEADEYLQEHKNESNSVPIENVLNAPQLKQITGNIEAVRPLLYASRAVIISENGVRPWQKPEQNTLILRDISSSTPQESIEAIFKSASECPPVQSIRSDIGDMWFVTFTSEAEARTALEAIRHSKFEDKQIKARLKTESLQKSYYSGSSASTPKNSQFTPRGDPQFFSAGGGAVPEGSYPAPQMTPPGAPMQGMFFSGYPVPPPQYMMGMVGGPGVPMMYPPMMPMPVQGNVKQPMPWNPAMPLPAGMVGPGGMMPPMMGMPVMAPPVSSPSMANRSNNQRFGNNNNNSGGNSNRNNNNNSGGNGRGRGNGSHNGGGYMNNQGSGPYNQRSKNNGGDRGGMDGGFGRQGQYPVMMGYQQVPIGAAGVAPHMYRSDSMPGAPGDGMVYMPPYPHMIPVATAVPIGNHDDGEIDGNQRKPNDFGRNDSFDNGHTRARKNSSGGEGNTSGKKKKGDSQNKQGADQGSNSKGGNSGGGADAQPSGKKGGSKDSSAANAEKTSPEAKESKDRTDKSKKDGNANASGTGGANAGSGSGNNASKENTGKAGKGGGDKGDGEKSGSRDRNSGGGDGRNRSSSSGNGNNGANGGGSGRNRKASKSDNPETPANFNLETDFPTLLTLGGNGNGVVAGPAGAGASAEVTGSDTTAGASASGQKQSVAVVGYAAAAKRAAEQAAAEGKKDGAAAPPTGKASEPTASGSGDAAGKKGGRRGSKDDKGVRRESDTKAAGGSAEKRSEPQSGVKGMPETGPGIDISFGQFGSSGAPPSATSGRKGSGSDPAKAKTADKNASKQQPASADDDKNVVFTFGAFTAPATEKGNSLQFGKDLKKDGSIGASAPDARAAPGSASTGSVEGSQSTNPTGAQPAHAQSSSSQSGQGQGQGQAEGQGSGTGGPASASEDSAGGAPSGSVWGAKKTFVDVVRTAK